MMLKNTKKWEKSQTTWSETSKNRHLVSVLASQELTDLVEYCTNKERYERSFATMHIATDMPSQEEL